MAKLTGAVVVITGASSGIGRASACAFAARGARLVLAARRQEALEEVAKDCRALGAEAIAVSTDVRDEAAVDALAERAVAAFGRIDVWVNNAGVALFARIEDVPTKAFRELLDTNVMGVLHGSRAAVRHFRTRNQGVLIQVASALGVFAAPYVGAYAASKFAVVGLTSALRQELRQEANIHVCTLLPASIDTPIYEHAANYTGRAVKPMSPVVRTERVARAIVRCAERPRRQMVVGLTGALATVGYRVWPGLVERLIARRAEHAHFRDGSGASTDGNVFAQGETPQTTARGRRARTGRSARVRN